MARFYFDQTQAIKNLVDFFKEEKATIENFGSKVNQTFEAYVFSTVLKYYKINGWTVSIKNPRIGSKEVFKLKFNTRGAPTNYSYGVCVKDNRNRQIRHNLRVQTKHYRQTNKKPANIVCDIAIIEDTDLSDFTTETALPNNKLVAFGEVKHMSGFAELIANFIGLTFELQPARLKRIRIGEWKKGDEISCFLYVSGILYTTAQGITETIEKRKYDVDIYSFDNELK